MQRHCEKLTRSEVKKTTLVVMCPLQSWPLNLRCHRGQILEEMCNTFAHHCIFVTHLISVNMVNLKMDMQKNGYTRWFSGLCGPKGTFG